MSAELMSAELTPADLAKFVHLVPVGATIPAGVRYAELNNFGCITGPMHSNADQKCHVGQCPRWTAEPLARPMPPLPTEPGSVIANVQRASTTRCPVMTRGIESWVGVDEEGYFHDWPDGEITTWTPARVVTDEIANEAQS